VGGGVHLIQGRLAIALSFSTAAHVGLVWMVGDDLRSSAAPAQRALTVSMTPAAPRALLNSIAPSATAAVPPTVVRPIEPSTVAVIDEPDAVVTARVVDTVELLDAPLVESRGPERTLRAREAQASIIAMAVARQAEMNVTRVRRRSAVEKPLPVELDPRPATSMTVRAEPKSPPADARAPARQALAGDPGSGTRARAPMAVAGQPGADRNALPASGNEPPEYPWGARRRGHQGRVVLSVWVSAQGQADRLAVLHSSGHATLDRAAVEAVERWRFQPARRGGHDTGSMLYVPVVFRLDE
jgi:protein TonB